MNPGKGWNPDFEESYILEYSECRENTSFSILGFFRLGVKLGFEFPEVLLNQKL